MRNYNFYDPSDASISIVSLEAMETSVQDSMAILATKFTDFTNERIKIIHFFDDKGGLTDRARRAKMHVKRKYGGSSPEYKALVNKKY